VVFGIADDGHAAAAGKHNVAFGHALSGIVRALGMNIGSQQANQLFDIQFIKDGYCIDVCERCQQLGALVIGDARPALSLDLACAGIRIDGYDQPSAQFLGGAQIAYMADVKEIEAAIGQDDPVTGGAPPLDLLCQFRGRKNFLGGLRQFSPP